MKGRTILDLGRNTLSITFIGMMLSGCLVNDNVDEDDEVLNEKQLSGSVGDGPVVGATMRIVSKDAEILSEFQSDTQGTYVITIEATDSQYPLFLSASNGTDLVTNLPPDFILRGVALRPSVNIANVNPFTTLAIEIARDLPGGLIADNLEAAEAVVVHAANSGLSSLASTGPFATRIDANNVAEIVKASEALSEIVRRTRDLLSSAGYSSHGDLVMAGIGSDLIDDVVDGRGGPRSDARTAALATVVGAQVLLEAMCNELHVNGTNATSAMAAAIDQVSPATPQPALGELTATATMVTGARIGVSAAYAVSNDPKIAELGLAIAGLQAGMDPQLVKSILPDDYRDILNDVLLLIANGDSGVLETVNEIARTGDITIDPPNRAPTISGDPDDAVQVGASYEFVPSAGDPDQDALTFSIINRPSWASFNSQSGRLAGTPENGDSGTFSGIVIEVSDGELTDSLGPFSINVFDANTPPTIGGSGAATIDVGETYDFTPTSADVDGDALTFTIDNQPTWASFDSVTGRLFGTPGASDAGNWTGIVIRVSDGEFTTSLNAFVITVLPPNRAPQIGGQPPPTATVGTPYSFLPTSSDPDGDTLSFSIGNAPPWTSFNTSNGRISGTPGASHVGTHTGIMITVSDGELSSSFGPFSIEVVANNSPPTIEGQPDTQVTAGQAYSFTPTIDDPDNDPLTITVSGLPSWASFDPSDGTISGIPDSGDVGTYSGISITVSDGISTDVLGPFSIIVVAENSAPTIGGQPDSQVLAGQGYSFTPTADDVDDDTLTFSVSGLPSWANFDPSSGTLSGTPDAGDVGVYSGIAITVSDGVETATLGPFSIEVVAIATGSVTLSWTVPTQNEDGSPLTDLAGFRIYWGMTPGSYPNSVTLDNPGLTTYVVEDLVPGTYEFVATSYNEAGMESAHSVPASATVP